MQGKQTSPGRDGAIDQQSSKPSTVLFRRAAPIGMCFACSGTAADEMCTSSLAGYSSARNCELVGGTLAAAVRNVPLAYELEQQSWSSISCFALLCLAQRGRLFATC